MMQGPATGVLRPPGGFFAPGTRKPTIMYEEVSSDDDSDADSDVVAVPVTRPKAERKEPERLNRPLPSGQSLLSAGHDLINHIMQGTGTPPTFDHVSPQYSAPARVKLEGSAPTFPGVRLSKDQQLSMIREKNELQDKLDRFESRNRTHDKDALQPQRAKRPATETVAGSGVSRSAKSHQQPAPKRRRVERSLPVTIPDIDIMRRSTFDVIPTSTKFRKFVLAVIRNGCRSFVRKDAEQVQKYASRHTAEYFALKDGWANVMKKLTDEGEVLKGWYVYDCLTSMEEFKNPEVRSTWEVRLPEYVSEFMDIHEDNAEIKEKYFKLLNAWRGRLAAETMAQVRKKLASRGINLPDNAPPAKQRFRFKSGDVVEFLAKEATEWVAVQVSSISSTTVTLRPQDAGAPPVTVPYAYAALNTRKQVTPSNHLPTTASVRQTDVGESPFHKRRAHSPELA
ncbi:hypothetical protein DIPPA_30379 [Diplonema papillatum]|nr:hypothetical protein DIPPA_30379 [Diplonema papillatum]